MSQVSLMSLMSNLLPLAELDKQMIQTAHKILAVSLKRMTRLLNSLVQCHVALLTF